MEQTWELKAKIEALLVASGGAVSMAELARCLEVTGDDAPESNRPKQSVQPPRAGQPETLERRFLPP